MRLSHNIPSLNIFTGYSNAVAKQSTALQRISSGLRVSSAKDDPTGIARSETIDIQVRGLQIANKNLQDGASMLQTTEGGLNEISSSLQRIRELTVQANNGSSDDTDKQNIQNEISQMIKNINDLSSSTTFNGVSLIGNTDPSLKPIMMAVGANPNDTLNVPTYNFSSNNIGDGVNVLSNIDVTTNSGADSALKVIDGAISQVTSARSKYGALENRFDTGQQETNEISDRLADASSDITDSDIAAEMVEYSKNGIIQNASTAMIAQTNKFPQDILKILENVR